MYGRNRDIYSVAERLGIPHERIIMTEGSWKWSYIKKHNINMHFDDVPEEVEQITKNVETCIAMLIWDEYSKGSIKSDEFGNGMV
jgi:uncharacterized HAD superfamily protein